MTIDFDDEASLFVRVHWVTRALFSIGLLAIAFTFYEILSNPTRDLAIRLFIELAIDFGLFKLASSYVKVNLDYILVNIPYGTFKINWTEIRTIKTNRSLIAFMGDNKRVIIALTFGNKYTKELVSFIYQQARKHNIDISHLKPGEKMPTTHLNSRE